MTQESRKRIFALAAAFSAVVAIFGIRHLVSRFKKEREQSLKILAENSQLLQTAKGPIEVSIRGSGPAVLAVHGAAGGYDQGKLKSDTIEGVTYISVSRPGYLGTPLSTGRSPSEQADAMASLLDVFHIEKSVFIGTSTGGLVGLYFALRHPQRCRALVLISAVNAPLPLPVSPLAVFSPLMADDFLPWTLMRSENLLRVRPDLRKQIGSQPEKMEILDELIHTAYPTSLRLSGLLNDAIQIDHLKHIPLEQVQVPTLVIHGTQDEVVPFQHGVRSACRIPQARFLPVYQGTHYCALTHLELVFSVIGEFIYEHSIQK
jgi:pimeloyl-ACP methyl ester carboxylesterase